MPAKDIPGGPIDPTSQLPWPPPLKQRYYFTVEAKLETLEAPPGEARGPRGARIYAIYSAPSPIKTIEHRYESSWKRAMPRWHSDPKKFEPLYLEPAKEEGDRSPESGATSLRSELAREKAEWQRFGWTGLNGGVLSGADFLLVRPDGVLELDGRITIRAKDETLIDAVYRGLIDLETHFGPEHAGRSGGNTEAAVSAAYSQFVEGEFPVDAFPLELSVSFETNTGPWSTEEAEDSTWTKPSQARHRGNVWKYAGLVRRQFSAFGSIRFAMQSGRVPQPLAIGFDVVELVRE